jgi:ORF6N domain
MNKKKSELVIPDEVVMNKIYVVRGQRVMIDRELAELYGVETKVLKQAVRRNIIRFPEDFMFEMSIEDFANWRSQNVTSREDRQGLRYAPFCFTEQGVTMLSCILNSERAVVVNIQIIRIFIKLRQMISTNKDILFQLEKLEKKITSHDKDIRIIFKCIKQLLNPPQEPRTRIGFRRSNENDPI